MMHPRHALLIACAAALALHAAEPKALLSESAVRQAQLNRAYESFRQKLAVLAGRLELSTDPKEKDRAAAIRKAILLAGERGTDGKFESLLRSLGVKEGSRDIDLLGKAGREIKELREDLQKILALLNDDGRDAALKKRQEELKELLARLKALRAGEQRLQARTEMKRGENKDLMKAQDGLTKETKDVAKAEKLPEKARKPTDRAAGKMGAASGKLGKGDNAGAADAQAGAVADLDEAVAAVEEELNETEREQRERKLRDLLARVKRMHAYQKTILAEIESVARDVAKSADGKPTLAQAGRANKASDVQLASLREADGAIKLLKDDGTGVAFLEVMEQVAADMDVLKRRLDVVELGAVTQKVADDVVQTLADMIKALEKAIEENKPGSPGGGGGRPGKDPPLVNLLQQLKMVFAMQRRVNERTELYGKRFAGEQAPAAAGLVREELGGLARRQERIGQVTREIGKQSARTID